MMNLHVERTDSKKFVLLALVAGFCWLAFSGLGSIPFHPDESTQLYMSADFDLLLSDPQAMAWQANQEGSDSNETISLDEGGVQLAIVRHGKQVVIYPYQAAAYFPAWTRMSLRGWNG